MTTNTFPTSREPLRIDRRQPAPAKYPFSWTNNHSWTIPAQGVAAIAAPCMFGCNVCRKEE